MAKNKSKTSKGKSMVKATKSATAKSKMKAPLADAFEMAVERLKVAIMDIVPRPTQK